MILKAALATVAVATMLLIVRTEPAFACSCDADVVLEESLADSDGAFVGVYLGRDDPFGQQPLISTGRPVTNHFVVERRVKGEIGDRIAVEAAAGGASCGLELEVGERTGLLLRREGDGWGSSLCSQTEPEALLAFAPGSATSDSSGNVPFVAIGFTVLAATVAVAAGLLLQRSQRSGWRGRRAE